MLAQNTVKWLICEELLLNLNLLFVTKNVFKLGFIL